MNERVLEMSRIAPDVHFYSRRFNYWYKRWSATSFEAEIPLHDAQLRHVHSRSVNGAVSRQVKIDCRAKTEEKELRQKSENSSATLHFL